MKDLSLDSADLAWLAGLARALLGEPHAADDLVQETAVAALTGPLPKDAPRRAWLGSVARRLAARRFRSDARRALREERAARAEALPDSTELVERAEIAEQVVAATRRLPEPFRRTILLRFLEGRSVEAIAREEEKPADTVRWRVRRGLELLREELVQKHDRDWSSWSVLLMPLARSHGDVGLATAGAAGVSTGTVASLTVMKTTIATIAALGCAGLWLAWDSGDERPGDAPVGPAVVETVPARPTPDLEPGRAPVERATRATATPPPPTEAVVDVVEPATGERFGTVVGEGGEPVDGAVVYLVEGGTVHARTQSDAQGAFRIARDDVAAAEAADEPALDLGVVANGYLRKVVPNVTSEPANAELLVVLERGRTLRGRVVDTLGRPVTDLALLACTAYAGVDHVSPSQRRLRAETQALADASSTYEQCHATTDARGEVVFTGLPERELEVLPLQPGWEIEGPRLVAEDEVYVEWTATRRLGVRLVVVDARTGRPVDRARATFRFEATFADGEVLDLGQWVGRGGGDEVSFVLRADDLPPELAERTITRAAFYGTVRVDESDEVRWFAEPVEDLAGAVGVAEVRVEVDPRATSATVDGARAVAVAEPGTTTLELDVRYDDATPFEGGLIVRWVSRANPARRGRVRTEPVGAGRYRVEVPAGALTLEVADRLASGSLPPWTGEVRGEPDGALRVFATLPRGATATIARPAGWSGTWYVHVSWRPEGEEEWLGSWNHGTDDATLTLAALRPAEWRFELRRTSEQRDPVVRTVVLTEGESALVDG